MNAVTAEAIAKYELRRGKHGSPEQGMCAMELVAFLAGEKHSDQPRCVSPVIGDFVRSINDRMNDGERNRILRPVLHHVMGTRTASEDDRQRGFMCADWAVRVSVSILLRAVKFEEQAVQLESVAPIVDRESANKARLVAIEVRRFVDKKWAAAANAAANAAAAAAEWAANATAAAAAAAAAAEWAAAAAANATAAAEWAAAANAAVLAEARESTWVSACDLLVRLCEVGRDAKGGG